MRQLRCIEPAPATPAAALRHYLELLEDQIEAADEGSEKAKDALSAGIDALGEASEELRSHV